MARLTDGTIWLIVLVANIVVPVSVCLTVKTDQVVPTLGLFVLLETFVAILWYTMETRRLKESAASQVSKLDKSQQQTTFGDLYTHQQQVTLLFSRNLELLPYFYDNKELPEDHPHHDFAMMLAEMLADFFEHVYLELELNTLPLETAEGWRMYAQSKYLCCPPLRRYLHSHRDVYGEGIMLMFGESQTPYGYELILDLKNCDISDHDLTRPKLMAFFAELCDRIGMRRHGDPLIWENKSGISHLHGISAIQFIETSNVVCHPLTLLKCVYVNIFSCKKFDTDVAKAFCVAFWKASSVTSRRITRN